MFLHFFTFLAKVFQHPFNANDQLLWVKFNTLSRFMGKHWEKHRLIIMITAKMKSASVSRSFLFIQNQVFTFYWIWKLISNKTRLVNDIGTCSFKTLSCTISLRLKHYLKPLACWVTLVALLTVKEHKKVVDQIPNIAK